MSDQASSGDQLITELNEMRRRIGEPEPRLRRASDPFAHWETEHDLLQEEIDKGTRVENEFAQTESFYRTLLETAKNVIWTVDLNLRYTYVSPSVTQVFGYPVEEIMAMSPLDGLAPESREKLIKAFREVLALEASGSREKYTSRTEEIARYHKDGSIRWEQITATFLRDSLGKPIGILGISDDVTERKRAEESLRNLLDFRKTLLDSIPSPVFYKDVKGRYIGCNESFAALVGLPKEEVVGKSVYEVVARELADIWHENDLELFRNPHVEFFEFTMPHPDGTQRTLLNHKAPFFDPDGILAGLIGVMVDVTVQKESEQALRVSEERMRLLIESSPVGICIVQDGKYAYVNPALTKIMGCEGPDEILGESALTFIAPEDRDLVQGIGKQMLEGLETSQSYQVAGLKRSGERFQVTIWPSRMDYLGKSSLFFFVADITPQKTLERQLVLAQKMEAVGILAAGIAHDFNNLLTIVQGYSESATLGERYRRPVLCGPAENSRSLQQGGEAGSKPA